MLCRLSTKSKELPRAASPEEDVYKRQVRYRRVNLKCFKRCVASLLRNPKTERTHIVYSVRKLDYDLKIKYDKQNGNKEVWEPVRRTRLLHLDDLEILNQYNAEIRGLYNYYRLAMMPEFLNISRKMK